VTDNLVPEYVALHPSREGSYEDVLPDAWSVYTRLYNPQHPSEGWDIVNEEEFPTKELAMQEAQARALVLDVDVVEY
jgi:hypothetical protein